jgi:hypothetical protein
MKALATACAGAALLLLASCKDKDVDASDEQAQQGEACEPGAHSAGDTDADAHKGCVEGLACEPVGDSDTQYVCAAPLEIRGQVFDALSQAAIEGALVSALDETGAPVTDVAVTDADGNYVLAVSARRDADGEIAQNLKWTLFCTAADYQPFPAGVRPAIPVNAADAIEEAAGGTDGSEGSDTDGDVLHVVENASTSIALIPLPDDQRGGATISGTVGGEAPAGTLVVAEGGAAAPYTIADASGGYTIFNVPDAGATIVGYRQGLSLETVSVSGGGEQMGIDLPVVTEGIDALPSVSGSVNIVNAAGGSQTSVVLVPVSVYNDALERGPVPFGLRAPQPPAAPSISSAFDIPGVPPGTFKVLAAFENDLLVRDPDDSIAGTAIQEINVAGGNVAVAESFKVTESLAVVGPGADAPQEVSGMPTFEFADDSSEDRYEIVVFDALGELVWEDAMVAGVSGQETVVVPYGGPALTPGMYYQFRATSFRDTPQGSPAISRTEDLRGVFVFR